VLAFAFLVRIHADFFNQAHTITGCLSAAQAINKLRQKYSNASLSVGSLCTELTITSVSLSQIQDLLGHDDSESSTPAVRPELLATFDTALVGCIVVLSCIEDEVANIRVVEPGLDSLTSSQKIKAVWKDDNIKELVLQLRAQQSALNLLMQTIEM
jgi:hypothetical protein